MLVIMPYFSSLHIQDIRQNHRLTLTEYAQRQAEKIKQHKRSIRKARAFHTASDEAKEVLIIFSFRSFTVFCPCARPMKVFLNHSSYSIGIIKTLPVGWVGLGCGK